MISCVMQSINASGISSWKDRFNRNSSSKRFSSLSTAFITSSSFSRQPWVLIFLEARNFRNSDTGIAENRSNNLLASVGTAFFDIEGAGLPTLVVVVVVTVVFGVVIVGGLTGEVLKGSKEGAEEATSRMG
mgnify:CR=1 FL=1